MVAPGSLPSLRINNRPAPSLTASAPPMANPRASIAATRSTGPSTVAASASTAAARPTRSSNSVVMSRNWMPGLGKSGMVRTSALNSSWTLVTRISLAGDAGLLADTLAPGDVFRRQRTFRRHLALRLGPDVAIAEIGEDCGDDQERQHR